MKTCKRCNIEKNKKQFWKDKQKKDGLTSHCIDCLKEKKKKYNKNNKDYIVEYNKKYSKQRYSQDIEYRELTKTRALKRYHDNPKLIYLKQKEWRQQNQDHHNSRQRKRYSTDINFRLNMIIRSHLRRIYLNLQDDKLEKTFDLLGYTVDQFKQRIEFQFNENMNWDNYGKYWEIDHIKSVDRFIKQGETRPHIINALSNLRPLEITKNRSKGNKLLS